MDEKLKQLLTDERNNKATYATYTQKMLEDVEKLYEEFLQEVGVEKLLEAVTSNLNNYPKSVILHYFRSIYEINSEIIDNDELTQLISNCADHKNWEAVIYLSKKLYENSNLIVFALNALSDAYDKTGDENKKIECYKELIRVDSKDTATIHKLAEYEINKGDNNKAFAFYKKAIQRYSLSSQFNEIDMIYDKLEKLNLGDFSFFYNSCCQIEKTNTLTSMDYLFEKIYKKEFNNNNYDNAIIIVKHFINSNYKVEYWKKALIDIYKKKYSENTRLNAILKKTLLNNSMDLVEAIEHFEKVISFEKKCFVYHKSWNIGRVKEITKDSMIIDFTTKANHKMSLDMAYNSLKVLDKTNIEVLKAVVDKKKLVDKITSDTFWALKTLINSSDSKSMTFKEMKALVVPSLLTANQWTTFLTKAKKEALVNPLISCASASSDALIIRDTEIAYDEKVFELFRNEEDFNSRIKIYREFLNEVKEGNCSDSYLKDFIRYFTSIIDDNNSNYDQKITSLFIVNDAEKKFSDSIDLVEHKNFIDLVNEENCISVFKEVYDSETKKHFLTQVKKHFKSWPSLYTSLFNHYLTKDIPNALENLSDQSYFNQLFKDSVDRWQALSEQFLYLVKSYDKKLFNKIGISEFTLLITKLQLFDYSNQKIANKKLVLEYTKYKKILVEQLFDKDKELYKYLEKCDENDVSKIYPIVMGSEQDISIKHKILERFPNYAFYDVKEHDKNTTKVNNTLYVTNKSYYEMKKELEDINDVQIPANTKEIAFARELGDLKENSEYKYAKQKETQLHNALARLNSEINRAVVVKQEDVDPSSICFGTVVKLLNNKTNKEEVFTFMGPYESDYDKNIINYLAPFAQMLIGLKPGDSKDFTINEVDHSYKVIYIDLATF